MKLVRYGAPGNERPGLVDRDGAIRALFEQFGDLTQQYLRAGDVVTLGIEGLGNQRQQALPPSL